MFSSVQSLSRVQLFVTTWTTAHQASPSNFRSLLKLMSFEQYVSEHENLHAVLLIIFLGHFISTNKATSY